MLHCELRGQNGSCPPVPAAALSYDVFVYVFCEVTSSVGHHWYVVMHTVWPPGGIGPDIIINMLSVISFLISDSRHRVTPLSS